MELTLSLKVADINVGLALLSDIRAAADRHGSSVLEFHVEPSPQITFGAELPSSVSPE